MKKFQLFWQISFVNHWWRPVWYRHSRLYRRKYLQNNIDLIGS